MKKILTLAIAAAMLFTTATSCSSPAKEKSTTASDTGTYKTLIEDRLGYFPENVILGIGSDAEYGIDMTDFEADGYIIRTTGDNTVIFGKTADGLDRAVRKYTNSAKSGTAADFVYHEGYRVENFSIAGRDISEYTIYYPADANENMKLAAAEFVRLVKEACGAELAAVQGEPVAPYISFAFSDDPELRDEGYVYNVTEDGLTIEGAVARGTLNGALFFLQWEMGWDGLINLGSQYHTGSDGAVFIDGDSFLNEADFIDVPAGTTRSETPVFDYFRTYNPYNTYVQDRTVPTAEQISYGSIPKACHGLQSQNFFESTNFIESQPCFTDEEAYETCRGNVEKFIAARYGKPGFNAVDIAVYDTDSYCFCDTCFEVFLEEGGNAGAVVRFANKLSEEMNEKYPGLVYLIFAYQGTNVPPKKTAPNDMIYVTYCFDLNCSNHTIDGKNCSKKELSLGRRGTDFAAWFEGWCDLTDNIYVWYYTLGTALQAYTVIDNIYDDYKYFAEHNVKGIFLETENYGEFGIKRIENQLEGAMAWDNDMTREEFEALYCRLLEKEYGPGWTLVYDYVEKWEESQDIMDCWHGWGWNYYGPWDDRYSTTFYANRFDEFCNLMEGALSMTESKAQEKAVKRLYVTILYMGCFSSYYNEWLEGDTDRIAVLSERYDRCMNMVRELGCDPTDMPTINGGGAAIHYSTTLEEAAWKDWTDWYKNITGQKLPADAPVIH